MWCMSTTDGDDDDDGLRRSRRRRHDLLCDVTHCAPFHIDKIKVVGHFLRHPRREAAELLGDVLLKRLALPPPHFLYLPVAVSRKVEALAPPRPLGVCINPVDGDAPKGGVIQSNTRKFEGGTDVIVGDIVPLTLLVKAGQEVSGRVACVSPYVAVPSTEGTHGRCEIVAVVLLMDESIFVAIFLVCELEG